MRRPLCDLLSFSVADRSWRWPARPSEHGDGIGPGGCGREDSTSDHQQQSVGNWGNREARTASGEGEPRRGSPHLRPRARDRLSPRRTISPPPILRQQRRHCSQVPSSEVLQQRLLIQVIKEARCIKRFIPCEFGADPDKVHILGMDYDFYEKKAEIRRCIEKENLPHTYICCNFFQRYLLPSLVQPGLKAPPRDKVHIFGEGNIKAVFVDEKDVATFTICAIDDTRTLNKVVYLRPQGNVYSLNELVEIWEVKIGKKLEKIYITEEQLLRSIHEIPYPSNMEMIFIYSAFVKGDHTYFGINSSGLDGSKLYPHVRCKTVDEYLSTLLDKTD
ncbi:probable pinoresinol-lariciresinol reductase 3 isoform X1 [Zingiber officinale]|uniref:probable pinoresinol-lariciresinol reductase 3 isoform X1 n=1 Tax=Zingiber officinale TaxID=94328 RepID=UPI001C4BD43C|nr:probable pinoresinol-lariciresinol reductase 3 isoform X1 [Zingiber officinale]